MIPYKIENKTRFVSHTPIDVVLGFLTLCNRTRKKKRTHILGRKTHCIYLFTTYICRKCQTTKRFLELVNYYGEVVDHMNHLQVI